MQNKQGNGDSIESYASLLSGTLLSHYRIIDRIGAGGMGEVYRGQDTRLGRDVAIKVLSPRLALTPEVHARFEREARTISQLNHPRICTLHDIGHQDGMDYLVMELVEGETLEHRLEKGPLPAAEVLSVGAQIAEALDVAHRRGIVHRDLKPGNVMLTKAGVKLMDFGLARASAISPVAGRGSDSPTMSRPLTEKGTIVGTFQYMAPEQLEGKEADTCSDIWALGCVLHEMATGKRAFEGASSASLISAIMKDEPRPITELQPLTPAALERIVKHCLEKDPEKRFQSARDLAFDLGAVSGIAREGARAAHHPARREALGWAIAALAVVGAVILLVVLRGKGPAVPEPVVSSILPPTSSVSCFRDGFALSPDGREIAFVSLSGRGERQVWLGRLDRSEATLIPGTEDASYPFWSPDSKTIAFYAGGQLRRVSADGGPVQAICRADIQGGRSCTWGTSEIILFTDISGSTSRVSAGGGEPTSVSIEGGRFPCFLPDGRRFLYVHRQGSQSSIYLASLDDPGAGREIEGTSGAGRAEWSPDDWLVLWLSADRSLVAQRVDLKAFRVVGTRRQLAERVPCPANWPMFSVSGAGTVAFVVNPPEARNDYASRLVWVDRRGNQVGNLGEVGGYWFAAISPDCRRVAVSPDDDTWIFDVATGVPTRLTMEMDKGGEASQPVWSPDGKSVVVYTTGGRVREFTVPGGQSRELYEGDAARDWSRDGRYLAVDEFKGGGTVSDLAYFDFADGQIKTFVAGVAEEFGGRFSPDGHWIAYQSNETGSFEVYVRAFPGGDHLTRVSRAGGLHPRWRADGRELFFLAPDWTVMAAPVHLQPSLEIGTPAPLFRMVMADFVKGFFPPYDVAPDGQRFLVILPQTKPVPLTLVQNWSRLVEE